MSDLTSIYGELLREEDDRKEFTEQGFAMLVELLTQGDHEIFIEGDEIELRLFTDGEYKEAMRVRLANVIAASVYWVGERADDDPNRAYCTLYGLAGLLREGAELAEATARTIEPDRWREIQNPGFYR